MAVSETTDDYERIFQRYLEICNEAVEENKDKFPYAEIWRARQKTMGQKSMQCAVYDDRPKVLYALQLTDEMKVRTIGKRAASSADIWPFNYSYLKSVVDNPRKFIEHPATLDWGWLDGRFS